MVKKFPRSPYDKVQGLVYFPRMLDKIRIYAAGLLPESYHPHLGDGFDGRCLKFFGVKYDDVKNLVLAGEPDEVVFAWCQKNGRGVTEDDIEIWNGFMTKRGWRDEASERVKFRLEEAGLEHLDLGVATMFDFIEVDEGRTPPDFRQLEPPRFNK